MLDVCADGERNRQTNKKKLQEQDQTARPMDTEKQFSAREDLALKQKRKVLRANSEEAT